MIATLITAPTVEPITLDEAKDHLRVEIEDSDQDTVIKDLITAAREYAENYTHRALVTQTWDVWFDRWPSGDYIELPKPPLQSVTTVSYTDYEGSSTSLVANTDYVVDTDSLFGRVVLEYDKTWPTATLHPKNPIKVRFVSGYSPTSDSPPDYRANVPKAIKSAMLLLIGHWFNHRENSLPGMAIQIIPMGADSLMSQYRAWSL
jgi:uncharacterized phiE125 gp8 family phage protein